jgi:hypothetical protein
MILGSEMVRVRCRLWCEILVTPDLEYVPFSVA